MLENYLGEGKFRELGEFIRKLKEYHVSEYNLYTNNYKMISDFKEEIDVDARFVDYVLAWIKRNYDAIDSSAAMGTRMANNQSALQMLAQFCKNAPEVRQEVSLFELLSCIRRLDSELVLVVEEIKKEAGAQSSFIFLMRRFLQLGVDKFKGEGGEGWLEHLNNFSEMFLAHKQYAYQEVADPSHPDFIRFLIELAFLLVEAGVFPIAKYLITKRIPNDHYYFKDALLYFLAALNI